MDPKPVSQPRSFLDRLFPLTTAKMELKRHGYAITRSDTGFFEVMYQRTEWAVHKNEKYIGVFFRELFGELCFYPFKTTGDGIVDNEFRTIAGAHAKETSYLPY